MATQLEKPPGFVERVQALGAFPADAVAHQHLSHFCFPRQICGPFPSEGEPAYFHTFSLTNEDGTREHGACLTTLLAERYGLHGLLEGRTAARPLSLVVFSKQPFFRMCVRGASAGVRARCARPPLSRATPRARASERPHDPTPT
jgi:hypothetical protein